MGIPTAMKWTVSSNANSTAVNWPGGRGVFSATGTWGGGTLTLYVSFNDGATWTKVDRSTDTYCTLSADGSGGFELPQCQLRVTMSGATSPSITAGVQSARITI